MKSKRIVFVGLGGLSYFMQTDHFHENGETVHATALYAEPGGKGYNQAVAAARLGADCAFLGAFGRDADGQACEALLQGEGILPLIRYDAQQKTACAFILTDKNGENRVSVYRGAADALDEAFVREQSQLIANAAMLVIGLETPIEATRCAAGIAFEAGVPVLLNPAPVRQLDMDFLRRCTLITPNRQEATSLLGLSGDADKREIAKALSEQGIATAVVTLGDDGAMLLDSGHAYHFPALPVHAVDTTGAGDAFNGALAAATVQGKEIAKSVEYAMNVAAISVSHPHVMTALPNAQSVAELYRPITPVQLF